MTDATEHCQVPWWKRPPVWFIGIAAVLALVIGVAIEESGKRTPTPYGTFLDQLEAGNVASVAFEGTDISGRFKHPLGSDQQDGFRSRVPDFGDPTLIPTLRSQHVVIDVKSQSQWMSLLGRIPWPLMLFFGAMIVAGVVRLVRGGKASSGSAASATPMGGMMGLVAGLFAKQPPAANPAQESERPKGQGIT
jgi:ATP-dependent Zn protease